VIPVKVLELTPLTIYPVKSVAKGLYPLIYYLKIFWSQFCRSHGSSVTGLLPPRQTKAERSSSETMAQAVTGRQGESKGKEYKKNNKIA
jgi:hypothetical protein